MSLAIAPAVSPPHFASRPSRRPVRRGWRPRYEGDFPTLGWLVLDWTHAYLPSPANMAEPLVYTDEQARRLLEWFRLDPVTGLFVYGRRLHFEEAKGFGKQPIAATLDLADFAGPVCFDGWDANGQPVGVPWGTGDRPPPWIQVAAVSEAQTRNTYSLIYAMLAANDHRAARNLRVDDGRTRLYLLDVPDAILEPVTASAGSRSGQRVTKATLDEVQLWTRSNGGHNLVETILDNLTKMDGRAVFTGNAYVKNQDTVAERFDVDEPGVLRYARRAQEVPQRDWPRERLVDSLRYVYADSHWTNLGRIVDDAIAPSGNFERAKRLFWNLPSSGEGQTWMPDALWESLEGDVVFNRSLPVLGCATIDHDHRSAAVAIAQRQGDRVVLRLRHFNDPLPEGEYLPLDELEAHMVALRGRFPAPVQSVERSTVRGRERIVARPGPEFSYHGMFLERSAQGLRARGLVMVDLPHTMLRLAPAAEALMELAVSGNLMHDGDPVLAAQMARTEAKETPAGWTLASSDGLAAPVAVRAAAMAIHRAMTAKAPPSRTLHPPRVAR